MDFNPFSDLPFSCAEVASGEGASVLDIYTRFAIQPAADDDPYAGFNYLPGYIARGKNRFPNQKPRR